jgi:hypothetical protein
VRRSGFIINLFRILSIHALLFEARKFALL